MGRDLDIVVTCTDRKSLPPEDVLRIRDLPTRSDDSPSLDVWLSRLRERTGPTMKAADLYQGESWTVSLDLAATARSTRSGSVRVWVLSAGYGLKRLDAELASYSATFSVGSPDFVGGGLRGRTGVEAAQKWWEGLCLSADDRSEPSSLETLAAEARGDLLLVLSGAYLRACHRDVVRAVSKSKYAIVLAPSAHRSRAIRHAAPPFDARLLTTQQDRQRGVERPIREGSRMSLNGRVARLLIERFGDDPIDRNEAANYLEELTDAQPPLASYDREDRSDDAVKHFIRQRLLENPTETKTAMLREFREAGNRCEQKRFGGLFMEVKSNLDLAESA